VRAAGAGDPYISRRSPDTPRSPASGVRREAAAHPQRGFAAAIVRIRVRMSAGTDGRPSRRRLFHVHHSRKPRRCQAMTVSGFTMTSAVRHPAQTRASMTQSQRSVFASWTRRGRVRCSTSSWCRKARISSWSTARDHASVRRVRRSERSTEIMVKQRTHRRPQHQLPQQERTFQ
jgi:hypothetical protein